MRLCIKAAVVLLLVGCGHTERYVELANEVKPKTVMVYVKATVKVSAGTYDKKNGFKLTESTKTVTLQGAGVYVSPNGHVLSCNHLFIVGISSTITVCDSDGDCREAELLRRDERRDLSLFKVDVSSPVPFATLADPRRLRVGQEVMAVGNPFGLDFTVTRGIISTLNRDLTEAYNLVQTDAPINPGNSGGPLFNLNGELVGIVVRGIPSGDGLGFCTESGQILEFLTKFLKERDGIEKAFHVSTAWDGFFTAIGYYK